MYTDLLCMEQNYFVLRGQIHKRFGTAMGNSLSSFIAEIFMANFETIILIDSLVYGRFVEDSFAVMNKRKIIATLN